MKPIFRIAWGGVSMILALPAYAVRPNLRDAFFTVYPGAVGSHLDLRADNTQHCGVCHYDFNGGGTRNPYGALLEAALPNYPNNPNGRRSAVQSIEQADAESDGYSTLTEVTDLANFSNTPTFPGLSSANVGQTSNIDVAEIMGFLTPVSGNDTTPPIVVVEFPIGGESLASSSFQVIRWQATDDSGVVTSVDVFLTLDAGSSYDPLGIGLANLGELGWFVANRPTAQARIRVEARDASNNVGVGESGLFSVYSSASGRVPTTLRDFDMPGTQPLGVAPLNSPATCTQCHGDYGQPAVEPAFNWRGSLMAQASIDPLFKAALHVANQDAPESGDLCLRCHISAGWLGGRSTPTDGSAMLVEDNTGVNCDLCHRMLDPDYEAGVSPIEDVEILAALRDIPQVVSSGQYVVDPIASRRRGPFVDAVAPHGVLVSPFHAEAAICGTCHDVSNPVFDRLVDGTYFPNPFDEPSGEFGSHAIGAVERTYSEWFHSAFNTPQGVFAPEFGGNKQYVASCQDCHMRDVTGQGCNDPAAPTRTDLPLHDMTGGSAWLPGVLHLVDPTVDTAALAAGASRARYMLQNAADLELQREASTLRVRVINRAGHKLPTGYPEGRRMWLNVRFFGRSGALLAESGAYQADTGTLVTDPQLKVYEALPVIGENIAPIVGLPPDTEFHFALNNKVLKDNRIPPLGFTNAAYEEFGGAPVGATYADGQNHDDSLYVIPPRAVRAEVTLVYQSLSREFAEFLRDNGGAAGQTLYDLWNANGKCPPETMTTATLTFGPGVGFSPPLEEP